MGVKGEGPAPFALKGEGPRSLGAPLYPLPFTLHNRP